MNECPFCHADVTSMTIRGAMVIDAGQSLAGTRMKVAAQGIAALHCDRCGWYAHGRLEDPVLDETTGLFVSGHFVVEPGCVYPPYGEHRNPVRR